MADKRWTPQLVEARIEEAADTLRRLPEERVQTARSSWPPIIREFHDAYGAEPARLRLGPPPAAAIDRMDQTLEWLRWLEPGDVKLVWARAEGLPWKAICWQYRADRKTLWRHWVAALTLIARCLNRDAPASSGRKGHSGTALQV